MRNVTGFNNNLLLEYFLAIERFAVYEKNLDKYNDWLAQREIVRKEILRRMDKRRNEI